MPCPSILGAMVTRVMSLWSLLPHPGVLGVRGRGPSLLTGLRFSAEMGGFQFVTVAFRGWGLAIQGVSQVGLGSGWGVWRGLGQPVETEGCWRPWQGSTSQTPNPGLPGPAESSDGRSQAGVPIQIPSGSPHLPFLVSNKDSNKSFRKYKSPG